MKNYNRMPENFLWGGATAANQPCDQCDIYYYFFHILSLYLD